MTVYLITGEQKQQSVGEVEELKQREKSRPKLRTTE